MKWFCFIILAVMVVVGCGKTAQPTEEEVTGERLDAEAEKALKEFAEYEKSVDTTNPTKIMEYIREIEKLREKLVGTQYVGKIGDLDSKRAKLINMLDEVADEPIQKALQNMRAILIRGDYGAALNELNKLPSELEKTAPYSEVLKYKEVLENRDKLPDETKNALQEAVKFANESNFNNAFQTLVRAINVCKDRHHSIGEEETDKASAEEKQKPWVWSLRMVVTMAVAVLDREMSDLTESGDFDKAINRCTELLGISELKDSIEAFINSWAVTAMNRKIERLISAGQFEQALQFLQGMRANEAFSGITGNIERCEARVREKAGRR